MTTAHAFVDQLFRAVREQMRTFDSGIASVVGEHETLERAQEAIDNLFDRMRVLPGMVYVSRLRPVCGCSLSELWILVGVERA